MEVAPHFTLPKLFSLFSLFTLHTITITIKFTSKSMGSFIRSTIFTHIPYFGLNKCLEQEPKRRFVAFLLHSVLMNSGRTGGIFFLTAQVSALLRRRHSPQFSTPSSVRPIAISALPRRLSRCLAPPVLQPGLHLVENCKMSRI